MLKVLYLKLIIHKKDLFIKKANYILNLKLINGGIHNKIKLCIIVVSKVYCVVL